ncbi:MAG: hypothetical protein ACTHOJ_17295 [Sphingomonas oligoaromativorans]
MTDNVVTAGAEAGESSLRDDLRAAFAEVTGREAGDETSAPAGDGTGAAPPAGQGGDPTPPASSGQPRDAVGRFAGKDGQPAAAPASAPVASPPAAGQQPAEDGATAPAAPAGDQAPGAWRADAKAKWAELPDWAKAEISRREADASRMATNIDGERRFGREIADVIRPYEREIQSSGVSPQFAIGVLMQNHRTMQSGPKEQKIALASRMLSEYGLDPRELINPNAPTDPNMIALQRQVQQMQQQLSVPKTFDHAPLPQAEQSANIVSDIDAFRADPAHTHFDQVAPIMATLLEKGHATDLTDAYVKATRSMGLEQQQQVAAPQPTPQPSPSPKPLADPAQKTAAARRASVSVARTPAPAAASPAPGSLRDELRENMRRSGLFDQR